MSLFQSFFIFILVPVFNTRASVENYNDQDNEAYKTMTISMPLVETSYVSKTYFILINIIDGKLSLLYAQLGIKLIFVYFTNGVFYYFTIDKLNKCY